MGTEYTFGNPLDQARSDDKPSNPLVDFVMSRFTRYESARNQLETKWDENYRVWRCLEDQADKTETRKHERSQIKIPASKEAVTNAVDACFPILFGIEPFLQVDPQPVNAPTGVPLQLLQAEVDRVTSGAHGMSRYMRYLFAQQQFKHKHYLALTSGAIQGTVVFRVEVEPHTNSKTKREQVPTMSPDGTMQVGTEEKVTRTDKIINRPNFGITNIENFYIDPYATGCQAADGADGLIDRSVTKDFELRRLKSLKAIDTVPENLGTMQTDKIKDYRLNQSKVNATPNENDVELFKFWGFVPNKVLEEAKHAGLDPDEELGGRECCIIIANREHLLKAAPNPFYNNERPYFRWCYEYVANEFYGVGIVEIARGPQRALDATVRSRIDNKALSINQLFAINVDKFLPGQTLSLYPGKTFLFRGDPREAMMPIVVPDVTSSTFQDAAEYARYVESATGVKNMVGGAQSTGGKSTATEFAGTATQAGIHIDMITTKYEEDVLVPLYKWYARIILQFLNDSDLYDYTKDDGSTGFAQITPGEIADDYIFKPLGAKAMQAKQEFQKRMNILQASANPLDAQIVNRAYMWKKAYESLGLDDTDIAIMGAPPAQQVAQADQAAPTGSLPGSQGAGAGNPGAAPTTEAEQQPGAIPEGLAAMMGG